MFLDSSVGLAAIYEMRETADSWPEDSTPLPEKAGDGFETPPALSPREASAAVQPAAAATKAVVHPPIHTPMATKAGAMINFSPRSGLTSAVLPSSSSLRTSMQSQQRPRSAASPGSATRLTRSAVFSPSDLGLRARNDVRSPMAAFTMHQQYAHLPSYLRPTASQHAHSKAGQEVGA